MTTIPAEPGFVVVVPLFDNDGIAGRAEHPVAAWRIEADSGQRVPMIDHGEVEEEIDVEEEIAEGRYALQTTAINLTGNEFNNRLNGNAGANIEWRSRHRPAVRLRRQRHLLCRQPRRHRERGGGRRQRPRPDERELHPDRRTGDRIAQHDKQRRHRRDQPHRQHLRADNPRQRRRQRYRRRCRQ